jgi:hypothetical protein
MRSYGMPLSLAAYFLSATLTATSQVSAQTEITVAQLSDPGTLEAFATCLVERHHADAATYVLGNYTEWPRGPISTRNKLKDTSCVPAQASHQDAGLLLQLSDSSMKAALAQVLVRTEFPTFDAAVILTAKPLPTGTLVDQVFPPNGCRGCTAEHLAQFRAARAKFNAGMAPLIFGECAVRTDPANTHALLMTWPGSAEEKTAFGALAAALDSCVVQGAQFTATRSVMRGLIALGYYRVAHAPRR